MLVLFETPAGYAIFKLLDAKKLKETDNLYNDFETPEAASKIIKLKHFEKFADTTEALAATTAAVEGKLSKSLKKVLKQVIGHDVQDQLLVADSKLGNAIKDKFSVQCVSNTAVQELMRCIRSQCDSLIAGLPKKEMTAMALGLAHSLSRYKLKFSPDKIDTMIIQAVSLLDDLDKELNNYIMRCREWYGWHFPELGKIITDNTAFVKVVKFLGTRDNAASSDLSDVLNEDLEEQVKEAAEISMGTEISVEDIINIQNLCDQVIEITNYRTQLYDYLKARMLAMAPNLSILVGDLVGARLISHAGSLINLAKHPASTVQILGAEKALFRALKAKKDTPKYGFIYHAQLIGQASSKNKGKMSRMLAAKASLAIRFDALGEDGTSYDLGAEHKAKLEARLRILEEGNIKRISGTGKAKAKFQKYQGVSEIKTYPAAADSTLKRKRSESSDPVQEGVQEETSVTPKQKKKKKSKEHTTGDEIRLTTEDIKVEIKTEGDDANIKEGEGEPQSITPKQKKKKKSKEHTTGDEIQLATKNIKVEIKTEAEDDETQLTKKKKKKKGKQSAEEMVASSSSAVPVELIKKESEEQPTTEKKKKKKKKHNE